MRKFLWHKYLSVSLLGALSLISGCGGGASLGIGFGIGGPVFVGMSVPVVVPQSEPELRSAEPDPADPSAQGAGNKPAEGLPDAKKETAAPTAD